jgi:hypothetical protein
VLQRGRLGEQQVRGCGREIAGDGDVVVRALLARRCGIPPEESGNRLTDPSNPPRN